MVSIGLTLPSHVFHRRSLPIPGNYLPMPVHLRLVDHDLDRTNAVLPSSHIDCYLTAFGAISLYLFLAKNERRGLSLRSDRSKSPFFRELEASS